MVAKREPPGAPKIPIFLTFSPKAPQAPPGPPSPTSSGIIFHDFGINFKISDQQKHYFEDHSLIILAFIFTISDQRKHWFWEFSFGNFGINSYGFWSTKALQQIQLARTQTHTHTHTHLHIHIHLHKHMRTQTHTQPPLRALGGVFQGRIKGEVNLPLGGPWDPFAVGNEV